MEEIRSREEKQRRVITNIVLKSTNSIITGAPQMNSQNGLEQNKKTEKMMTEGSSTTHIDEGQGGTVTPSPNGIPPSTILPSPINVMNGTEGPMMETIGNGGESTVTDALTNKIDRDGSMSGGESEKMIRLMM